MVLVPNSQCEPEGSDLMGSKDRVSPDSEAQGRLPGSNGGCGSCRPRAQAPSPAEPGRSGGAWRGDLAKREGLGGGGLGWTCVGPVPSAGQGGMSGQSDRPCVTMPVKRLTCVFARLC